jgi:hypothetical protein
MAGLRSSSDTHLPLSVLQPLQQKMLLLLLLLLCAPISSS